MLKDRSSDIRKFDRRKCQEIRLEDDSAVIILTLVMRTMSDVFSRLDCCTPGSLPYWADTVTPPICLPVPLKQQNIHDHYENKML